MSQGNKVLDAVRAAMRSEPRIRVPGAPIHLELVGNDLLMEGEVDHISGKRLAMACAARVAGVNRIIDRLHVRPAAPMGDGEIRDHVRDALLAEVSLDWCGISCWVKGQLEIARIGKGNAETIDIRVENGIVTLDGEVQGLGQKRMAGVLAWWVPGSRDVINGLGVTPPEPETEAALTDVVRQVLEKDPFINAESIQVTTRRARVALDGIVPSEVERELAENDAWYVFGVDDVINRLVARP